MLSIALVGYSKNDDMKKQTDVMKSLNLGLLTIIIIVAAAATVFTSFLGFSGAYFKSMLTLKLYVVLVLITFLTQVAVGAYLLNLDLSKLRTSWEQDDSVGAARRDTLQNYLHCCGFDVWSDSIGTLHTDCPYLPTWPQYKEPITCFQAARNFVDSWLRPIAIGAIVIGSIEVRKREHGTATGANHRKGKQDLYAVFFFFFGLFVLGSHRARMVFLSVWPPPVQSLAMAITFALIFKSKDTNSDTAFDY